LPKRPPSGSLSRREKKTKENKKEKNTKGRKKKERTVLHFHIKEIADITPRGMLERDGAMVGFVDTTWSSSGHAARRGQSNAHLIALRVILVS